MHKRCERTDGVKDVGMFIMMLMIKKELVIDRDDEFKTIKFLTTRKKSLRFS